jgi:hypothetical protein
MGRPQALRGLIPLTLGRDVRRHAGGHAKPTVTAPDGVEGSRGGEAFGLYRSAEVGQRIGIAMV